MLENPDWRSIFAPSGSLLKEGEIIRRTNLSRTLATIAAEGAGALYKVVIIVLVLAGLTSDSMAF